MLHPTTHRPQGKSQAPAPLPAPAPEPEPETKREREWIDSTCSSFLRHDFANRLQSVKMWVDLIARNPDSPPGATKVTRLKQSLLKLESYIEAACALVKVESIQALDLDPTPIQPLLQHACDHVRPLLKERRQRLHVPAPPPQPILAHPWASDALCEILDNASRYSPEGSRITVKVHQDPLCCRVEIRNGGSKASRRCTQWVGEDQDMAEALFCAEKRMTSTSGRPGLGLAMAHQIMRLHHGEVRVVPRPPASLSVFLDFRLA